MFFDAVARDYDQTFSAMPLAQLHRARTRARLAQFRAGMRVLELGCGTGEDAIWLAQRGVNVIATDASPAMLSQTRDKAMRARVESRIETRILDLNKLSPLPPPFQEGRVDAAFSNFGALNCVRDLRPLARYLAELLKPNAKLILVIMNPVCLWEIAVHLVRRDARGAFRRLQRGGALAHIGGNPIRVWYPAPRAVEKIFAPHFTRTHLEAIGVLLPPPYLSNFAARRAHWVARLAQIEAKIARLFPFNLLGDHYLIEFRKE